MSNHDDLIRTFRLDRNVPFRTKSRDVITVRYDAEASQKHYANEWNGKAACYIAINDTKGDETYYFVEFYLSREIGMILAFCTCPSRLPCKHIVRAWETHLVLEQNGFIKKLKEF